MESPRLRCSTNKWVLLIAFVTSLAANAQTDLSAEQIRSLVSGQTLAFRFPGVPPADPKFFSHWDFRSDGSLCGRLIGSSAATDCADVGVWNVQGNSLCWTLPRIGTSSGINSVCGPVRKSTDSLYELQEGSGKLGSILFGIGR